MIAENATHPVNGSSQFRFELIAADPVRHTPQHPSAGATGAPPAVPGGSVRKFVGGAGDLLVFGDAVAVVEGELVERCLPAAGFTSHVGPVGFRVADDQVEHLQGGLLVGEVPAPAVACRNRELSVSIALVV